MVTLLGVDPALANTGWAAIEYINGEHEYLSSGVIKTNAKKDISSRIADIYKQLHDILDIYQPGIVALEKIFINSNMKSSLDFAYARGAIMLTLAISSGAKIQEISPNSMKKRIAGNGHASKTQIAYMVQKILNIELNLQHDAYDALALALSLEV